MLNVANENSKFKIALASMGLTIYDLKFDTGSMNPLYYFISGALMPTIAYVFLLRKRDALQQERIETLTSNSIENEYEYSSDDGDEFEPIGGLDKKLNADPSKWGMKDAPYKMILCVNQELGMGKGKIAAQCCHAAVGCYKRAKKACPAGLRAWELSGCAKIAVKCPSEDEMMNVILIQAIQAGIPYYFVEDAGRTQIAAGSRTVLGLGPAPTYLFEGITSHLKLM
mmetsp:Transcript_10131/g.11762  ORF Transcript_10131/g.11762 Transcript_10131/m.11762 type:complete len:226 (+) Transcript_10131:23-700(+)